jgi:hypothetical protein
MVRAAAEFARSRLIAGWFNARGHRPRGDPRLRRRSHRRRLTITTVGMSVVFVPTDLTFMGLSAPELHAINPRLIP